MANNIKQGFAQIALDSVPKRIVTQYNDDVSGEDKQAITKYDDLSAGDKITFDDFQTLCESKMV